MAENSDEREAALTLIEPRAVRAHAIKRDLIHTFDGGEECAPAEYLEAYDRDTIVYDARWNHDRTKVQLLTPLLVNFGHEVHVLAPGGATLVHDPGAKRGI